MLVGIGLVGLVLFGAQKFLFNRNSSRWRTTEYAHGSDKPCRQPAEPAAAKPSPVGDSRAPDQTTQEPVKPPQTRRVRHGNH